MSGRNISFILFALAIISGCVVAPLPTEEYTLARAALAAAKDSGAERLAPGIWYKADENYHFGEKYLKEKDNISAKAAFLKSIEFAEKAENAARIKKFESGENFQ